MRHQGAHRTAAPRAFSLSGIASKDSTLLVGVGPSGRIISGTALHCTALHGTALHGTVLYTDPSVVWCGPAGREGFVAVAGIAGQVGSN